MIQGIHKILKGYKNIGATMVNISKYNEKEVIIFAENITIKQMRLISQKILDKYENLDIVCFNGGWNTWLFTRESLKRSI